MSSPTHTPTNSNQPGEFVVGLSTARFLDANLLDESGQTSPTAAPLSIPETNESTQAPPAAGVNDQDDGVPEYMNQLMQRLRNPHAASAIASNYSNSSTSQSDNSPANSLVEEKIEAPLTSEEFVPKKQAPERNTDMSSLRKLANDCTRVALSSFVEKQQKSKRASHLYVIAGGLAGAVACFGLYAFVGFLAAIGGVACLAAAIGGGFVFYRDKRNIKKA